MSKLEELIQQYCPDGVEYKPLGEVCDIHKGVQFNKTDMKEMGTYPVINGGINPSGYAEVFNEDADTITISQGGASAGYVNFMKSKFWLGAHCYAVKPNSVVMNRYVYHFAKQNEKVLQQCQYGAGIPALAKNTISSLEIPVPPMPVQEEIVRILDSFTELQAELQAELQKRKLQYNYYRDNLLSFSGRPDIKWMKLGEICDLLSGFPFDSTQFTSTGIRLMRGVNIKRGQLIFNETDDRYWKNDVGLEKYIVRENDIVISMDGSLVGKSFGMVKKEDLPLLLVQRVARIRSKVANINYVFQCIKNWFPDYVAKKKTQGAIPHISMKDISNFTIPVPSLDEQTRIADVLDRFDALTNDLTSGLPAEIEKRRQQYEYYRDKLLTFKRKTA